MKPCLANRDGHCQIGCNPCCFCGATETGPVMGEPGYFKDKDTESELRTEFPHGHPEFIPITLKELKLHNDKNHDYASGGTPLGNFERVAAIFALYPNIKMSDPRVVAFAYAMKQIDAALWSLNQNIEAKVEGLAQRLADVSVYAKIIMCMEEDKKNEKSIGHDFEGRNDE